MFGKPQWFRAKSVGWGLRPIAWQGWAYALAWMGVIAAPFVALVVREQVPEALIWLSATIGALSWDVHSIQRLVRGDSHSNVLYISEDGSCEPYALRR